jgi:hypothetical protein
MALFPTPAEINALTEDRLRQFLQARAPEGPHLDYSFSGRTPFPCAGGLVPSNDSRSSRPTECLGHREP